MKSIITLLIYCLPLQIAFAQQIITDRPDQTESSSTIPKSSFQIESGIQLNQANNINELLLPTTLLRYGVTKWLELRFANSVSSYQSGEINIAAFGFTDAELGVKVQILRNENINSEIAFLSHLVIPIGHENLSNYHYGTVNKISISHQLGQKWGLGYNIGYNYFGMQNGDITYSAALGYRISEKWGFYLEPYGEFQNVKSHISRADAGFTYLLHDNFQFDISSGLGLNESSQYFAVGFSWNSQ